MILTADDALYVHQVATAIDAGELARVDLTNWCPECAMPVTDFGNDGHVAVAVDPHGHVAVVIGCEGYWVVDPAKVGRERKNWLPRHAFPALRSQAREGRAGVE